jgi:iron complex transport system permease protein
MKKKIAILSIIFIVSFILDIALGSVNFKTSQILGAFLGQGDDITRAIILDYRIPKALTAILAGASLSVSGVLMQTLFRNPLAGPDVLGVTSGASLGVALLTLGAGFLPTFILGNWGQVAAAIIGAAIVMLLVIFVAMRVTHSATLLIVGLMFGYFTGAIVSIMQSMANPNILKLFITWTFGSLSAVGWNSIGIMATIIVIGLIGSLLLHKRLDTLILGDNYAVSLGTNVKKTRIIIIAVTALLTGTCTAFTGPIAFIGITIPHLTRLLLRSDIHRKVLPVSILCGAIVMLLCDVISQLPGGNITLPINSVTAIFGAPIIIWIILKR